MSETNDERVLTCQQEQVISLLLAGKTQRDAAEEAGVAEETVSRWRHGDALFVTTLNARRRDLWQANVERLRGLGEKAVATLEDLLESDSESTRLNAARAILKAQGMDVGQRPAGETHAKRLESSWKMSRKRSALLTALQEGVYK